MHTLSRSLRTLAARLPSLRSLRWAAIWGLVATAIQAIGVRLPHDSVDLTLALGLASLGLSTHAAHRRQPIGWWGALEAGGRRVRNWALQKDETIGFDLRGNPPIPRGVPRTRAYSAGLAAICVAAIVPFVAHLPGGLRELALYGPFIVYIAFVGALCMALLFVLVAVGFFGGALICDQRIWSAENGGRPLSGPTHPFRRLAAVPIASFTAALIEVPVVIPVAGLLGCLAASVLLTLATRRSGVSLTWSDADRGVRSAPLGPVLTLEMWRIGLPLLGVVFLACGSELVIGVVPGSASLVATLGRAAAWAAFGTGTVTLVWLGRRLAPARHESPAAALAPVVHIRPDDDAAEPTFVQRLQDAGFRVRVADTPTQRGELMVDALRTDVDAPDVAAQLRRRHDVLQRRLARRGLRRILRRAARVKYDQGTGFWIAPHLWIVSRLSRDTNEEQGMAKGLGAIEQFLAPDYATVMPLSARRALYEVFSALECDLLFLEDGIGMRGLSRVLTVMYEVHDIHGGARRIEERDFRGLTGIKVIVHELAAESPFASDRYPEPDYEDISRGRIVHVFKDRGGEVERIETPAPGDLVPLLV